MKTKLSGLAHAASVETIAQTNSAHWAALYAIVLTSFFLMICIIGYGFRLNTSESEISLKTSQSYISLSSSSQ